jgi:hypothetical protein
MNLIGSGLQPILAGLPEAKAALDLGWLSAVGGVK